jgi:hypothetical protein
MAGRPLFGPRELDPALLQAATHVTVRSGETTQIDLSISTMR